MPTTLRRLGVFGKNAPTKKSKTVEASDFSIGALIGFFERKYDKAFPIANPDEQREIFGNQINSGWFGDDVAKGFWDNLADTEGTLFIKSHVGFDGAAIDAVIANRTLTDQNGLASIVTLLTEELADYDLHDDDAELAAAWAFHAGQEAADHTPADVTAPKTLDDAITKMNDLKSKYNAHDADTSAHGVGSSHQVTAPAATDMTTAVALVNDLQTQLDAHAADIAQHTTAIDNVNFPLTSSSASETPASTLKAEAGYKAGAAAGALEYGTSGNRTGYTIANGVRFETQAAAVTLVGATEVTVDSAIGVKVGDIVVFRATGATPGVVNKKITEIDEANNIIKFSGAIGVTMAVDDEVEVPGFRIKTYRKSVSGIVLEVETELAELWCTMESEVTDHFVQNVHEQNKYIKWTDQASASTGIEAFPDDIPTVTLLASGADGTTPTIAAHWSRDLTKLNNLPVRMIANPETSDVSIQKAGEAYSKGRGDTPIWLATLPENRTKSQLLTLGAGYQRSDDVFQANVADWLEVEDPFNTAPNAPDRVVPNVGHSMGAWIRTIQTLGIHYIPAVEQITLLGANGVRNSNLGENISDRDRTDIAEYGVNIIQEISGQGIRIRNFFTPSTATEFLFSNGLLMRNFIKVSAEDSLKSSENTPNSFNRIKEDRSAIRNFYYRLWNKGNTGQVPTGETFGQQENPDGSLTQPVDHFQVIADAVNNPQSAINLGERTIDSWFTFPTPAGSIRINVGILLR